MQSIAAVAASVAAGILGAMGLGGGGILLLYLVFAGFGQLAAQGINLIFIIPVGITGLMLYRKNSLLDIRTALPICLGGILGVFAGSFIAGKISSRMLSLLFGIFVVILGTKESILGFKLLRHRSDNHQSENNAPKTE